MERRTDWKFYGRWVGFSGSLVIFGVFALGALLKLLSLAFPGAWGVRGLDAAVRGHPYLFAAILLVFYRLAVEGLGLVRPQRTPRPVAVVLDLLGSRGNRADGRVTLLAAENRDLRKQNSELRKQLSLLRKVKARHKRKR